jgi:adenine-specific DNA-methyltransferase
MPTLHWIGKEKVINHHLEVPYKVLNHEYGFSDGKETASPVNSGNLIINGDNLEALKSLLPKYEGKVDCIYIDPPYNTGNEGWVYNDNVNSSQINKWLGKVVGKESEDLTRHDKWLCMMYPRLQILHKLLSKRGAIFISIDDFEATNLKMLCDEIFGNVNYITSFVWRRRASSMMSQNNISVDHEYVLAYFKSESRFNGLKKDYKNYSNPDNDPRGLWTLGDLTVGMTKEQRPNQFFDLVDPKTGISYAPNSKRVWTFAPDTMHVKINEGRVVFPKHRTGKPMMKRYVNELKSENNPISSWLSNEAYSIGLNSEGTKLLQMLFEDKIFDYPKPISLVELLISQITTTDSIVLDSFAGSGTTAHAVLNLNKLDGGNRKFILIEMEDYAETITSERVKRVINSHANKEGISRSFDYYTLGEKLFEEGNTLNPEVLEQTIKEYVWYSETRMPFFEQQGSTTSYLGNYNDTGYYFIYEKEMQTTLDYEMLAEIIRHKAERYIVYADNCLLSESFMKERNIEFKKNPRDITRF